MKTYSNPPRSERRIRVPCNLCGGRRFTELWDFESYSFCRCASCGLIQQNPQSEAEAVRGRYADDYLSYELANESAFRDLALKALADVGFSLDPGRGGASFLDVGCATGALLLTLRERGWRTLGVEVCAPSADYARNERGLDVRGGTLESAGLDAAGLDAVYLGHVIEHLNDPWATLAEIGRILRPGGELIVITPNSDGFQARLFGREWRSVINDHLYLFSRRTLGELLRRTGFELVAAKTWGGWARGAKPAWLKPLLDPAAKRLGMGDVMVLRARKAAEGKE
jgi:SAM-dependent methyltransferase